MNQELRKDAEQIIDVAIASVQPDAAVRRALSNLVFSEHVYIVAIGKAGWQMANAAVSYLQENGIRYEKGVVLNKVSSCYGATTAYALLAKQDIRCRMKIVLKAQKRSFPW